MMALLIGKVNIVIGNMQKEEQHIGVEKVVEPVFLRLIHSN